MKCNKNRETTRKIVEIILNDDSLEELTQNGSKGCECTGTLRNKYHTHLTEVLTGGG